MVSLPDILEARSRLDGVTVRTPLIPLEYDGRTLYLKPENLQPIDYSKLSQIFDDDRKA